MEKRRFMGFERRRFRRISREWIIKVKECDLRRDLNLTPSEIARFKGRTKNVSAGGMLFEVHTPYPVGTMLTVEAEIPNWQRYKMSSMACRMTGPFAPFHALAKVVRIEEIQPGAVYDIGVVLVNIDPINKIAIKKYMDDNH